VTSTSLPDLFPSPELSVVVIVGPLRERAAGCLASLLEQEAVGRMEVLLVDLRSDLPPVEGASHPAVVTLSMPPETSFAEARVAAIRAARGKAVALVEEHSRALPGWAAAVLAAHAEGWAAVASEMHVANPGIGKADVNGVMNYGLFGPPLARGEGTMAPPFHTSFLRSALLDLGDELRDAAFSDICLWEGVRRRGGRLLQEPAARLAHINETSLLEPFLADFHFHRFWVGWRRRTEGWSLVRTAAAVLLFPAYPAYYLVLYGRRLRERNPESARVLRRHWLHAWLRQLGPALGQAAGILFGPGRAAARFTRYEIVERRGTANGPL
jgi:GT2 family glycosyltransferase